MHIRYLIINAYSGGGTVRTTLTMASALARLGHEVEVVSMHRRRLRTTFPVDRRVRLHALVDSREFAPPRPKRVKSDASLRRRARIYARNVRRALLWHPTRLSKRFKEDVRLQGEPSTEFHPDEYAFPNVTALDDQRLLEYLRGLDGGVVIGTRPGLNVAIARHAPASVLRIGQEHLNLQSLREGQREQNIDVYPKLDALITLTERDAEAYRGVLDPSLHVSAMPNAVPDTGGYRADVSLKRIVTAGRYTKQKAFWRLIEAFALVADEFPDWRVDIYGRGDRGRIWQRRIDNHGLQERVRLAGFTHDLYGEMAKSSIFALTSLFEGFGMVIVEAMSIGLPVISYDCPNGPRELIEDGVSGLLITPDRDVEAFAAGLRRLMASEDLRRSLVGPGLAVAEAHRPDVIGRRWGTLFDQLEQEKSRRGHAG